MHRGFGGLQVSDFPDEDDIRVLSKDRAKSRCEGIMLLGRNLRLFDAGEVVLDRVFQGNDLNLWRVNGF